MIQFKTKHVLTGEEFSPDEIAEILLLAGELKRQRRSGLGRQLLQGQTLALLFDKPSLRTRMSFTVAMQELGGSVIESVGATRKQEEPEDLARVLSGYCHGIMIRTFEDATIQRMANAATIPVINGLSDHFHPCQILADLLTIQEHFGTLKGVRVAYIGDGNNILQSFFPILEKTGLVLTYACPQNYGPEAHLLARYKGEADVQGFTDPYQAVRGADVIYTDVWTSMGFEKEAADRDKAFVGFQVNEELLAAAGAKAQVMHCMPMVRGQEISQTLPDSVERSLIFKQSENRLHAQKALLIGLMQESRSYGEKQEQFGGRGDAAVTAEHFYGRARRTAQ